MSSPQAIDHTLIGRVIADTVSAVAILGAFMGLLPSLAALGALVWYAINIYESAPVQRWLRLHRHKRRRKRTGRSLDVPVRVHRTRIPQRRPHRRKSRVEPA